MPTPEAPKGRVVPTFSTLLVLLIVFAAFGYGCGGSSSPPPPVVAPSIGAQPQSQTVTAPATATFSVSATGTTPLSYQWNKNGTVVSGATSSTYTTPATTSADDGAKFTVVVTNSAGSVTSNSAILMVNAAPAPDLSINLTESTNFMAGSSGSYTIAVKNVGNAATTGTVTVTDSLPAAMTMTGNAALGWSCTPPPAQTVSCTNFGPIAPGATAGNITLTVTINSNASGSISNTATVSDPGDTDAADKSSTATVILAPDLSITKSHFGNFTAWANGTLTISVNNIGSGATAGTITVSDILPSTFAYVSATGTGWTCQNAAQSVTCTNAGLIARGAATASVTLTIGVSNTASGSISNTATVSDPGDTDVSDKSSTDTVIVNAAPPPDLSITKTHTGNFTASSNGVFA